MERNGVKPSESQRVSLFGLFGLLGLFHCISNAHLSTWMQSFALQCLFLAVVKPFFIFFLAVSSAVPNFILSPLVLLQQQQQQNDNIVLCLVCYVSYVAKQ